MRLVAVVAHGASPQTIDGFRTSALVPASWLYGAAVACRNRLYDWGWLPSRRLPCRVVSIGNLTVGGTGKTPVVIWTVEQLLSQGRRVGILSRGYRRQSRAPQLLVSDGRHVLAGPDEAGDEPFLIAERCRGALVAVGADRYRVGRWLLDRHPVDCLVLDDGFQHRALHRDVDLLLLDATDRVGLHGLLPCGRLREPVRNAARATAIVLTRAEEAADSRAVLNILQDAGWRAQEVIRVTFRPDCVIDVNTGTRTRLEDLKGARVLAASGIGNPGAFLASLTRGGVAIVESLSFRDHHQYHQGDVDRIVQRAKQVGAERVLTTEKDAVKLRRWLKGDFPVEAVRLDVDIIEGRERLERLISAEC